MTALLEHNERIVSWLQPVSETNARERAAARVTRACGRRTGPSRTRSPRCGSTGPTSALACA